MYDPTIFNHLWKYDDASNFLGVNEVYLCSVAPGTWYHFFTTKTLGVYEPLAFIFKSAVCVLFGGEMTPYLMHTTTLVLHLLNLTLMLSVMTQFRILLGPLCIPTSANTTWNVFACMLVIAWGISPARVEVIAWASGQSYALCTLFLLLFALALLHQRYHAALILGICAMLSKLAALPLVCLTWGLLLWHSHHHIQAWTTPWQRRLILAGIASALCIAGMHLFLVQETPSSNKHSGWNGEIAGVLEDFRIDPRSWQYLQAVLDNDDDDVDDSNDRSGKNDMKAAVDRHRRNPPPLVHPLSLSLLPLQPWLWESAKWYAWVEIPLPSSWGGCSLAPTSVIRPFYPGISQNIPPLLPLGMTCLLLCLQMVFCRQSTAASAPSLGQVSATSWCLFLGCVLPTLPQFSRHAVLQLVAMRYLYFPILLLLPPLVAMLTLLWHWLLTITTSMSMSGRRWNGISHHSRLLLLYGSAGLLLSGLLLLRQPQISQTVAAWESDDLLWAAALQLDNGNYEAAHHMGWAALRHDDHAYALEVALHLHGLVPGWVRSGALLAKALLVNQRVEQAGEVYLAYLRVFPASFQLNLDYAFYLAAMDDDPYKIALLLERAWVMEPGFPRTQQLMRQVLGVETIHALRLYLQDQQQQRSKRQPSQSPRG